MKNLFLRSSQWVYVQKLIKMYWEPIPSIQPTTSSGVERLTTPYSVSHSSSGPKGSKLVRKFLNANILSELDGSILSTILCSASTLSVIVLKDVLPHFVAMIVRVRYSNFRKILTTSKNFVRRYAFLFPQLYTRVTGWWRETFWKSWIAHPVCKVFGYSVHLSDELWVQLWIFFLKQGSVILEIIKL